MSRKPKHLFTLAYARSKSATVALQALRFAIEYGRACDAANWAQSIEEYAAWVGCSRAQAFRRQQSFRQCFPNQDAIDLWERVIRPALDDSTFKNESLAGQAVFAGTLSIELSS